MAEAVARLKLPAGLWPVCLFGAAPVLLMLWDWSSGADLVARLWTMPIPLLALASAASLASLAAGHGPRPAARSAGKTGHLIGHIALGLFLYGVLATSIFAPNPVFGLLKLGELALMAALALALAALFRRDPDVRRVALWSLVLGTVLALPVLAVLRASGALDHLAPLMLPGFVHIRIMGFSLALALAGALGLWDGASFRERAALAVCLAVLWTALFWSGGRGALLAVTAGAGISIFALPRVRGALLPLVATALAGLALAQMPFMAAEGIGMLTRLSDSTTAATSDALSSGRIEMWRAILAASAERPFLGHGYAQARPVFLDAGFRAGHLHAHNILLDATLGLGLVLGGLSAVVALTAAMAGTVRARISRDPVLAGAGTLIWVFLAHALVDGIYFYAQGLMPLALGIALLLSAKPQQRL